MRDLTILLCLLFCGASSSFSQEKMEVEGAIIIQNSEDPTPAKGTIHWNGNDFQGWNGQRWVSLTNHATAGSVTDIDGNTYQTARIGNQEWMVENLRVTKYRDNSVIDQITTQSTWNGLSEGAWCYYNNKSSNNIPYGKLYNWYAVDDGRMLCPTGWHVPSESEWTTLIDYLGGDQIAGGRMKETGLVHWNSPNNAASNESGFKGIGGGIRDLGAFRLLGFIGTLWSSTEAAGPSDAIFYQLHSSTASLDRTSFLKNLGISVRCIRD